MLVGVVALGAWPAAGGQHAAPLEVRVRQECVRHSDETIKPLRTVEELLHHSALVAGRERESCCGGLGRGRSRRSSGHGCARDHARSGCEWVRRSKR